MAFAEILNKILGFLRWCWLNKWSIFFIITTIVFLAMYGCERRTVKKLNEQIIVEKAKIAQCEANYNTVVSANKEMSTAVDICKKELEITKESFTKAEEISKQFDEEIKKYKDVAKQIDAEKDAQKQLEMKKKLMEEIFKGKKVYQIMLKKKEK